MKFAKELEEDLVPEWRAKYLNYKAGKKKVKAISRALRHAEQQSPSAHRRRLSHIFRHEDRPTVDFPPPRSGFRQASAARGLKSFTPFQRSDSALQDLSRGKFGATLDVGIQGRQPLSPLGPRCNEPTDDDGNIIAPAPQRVPASFLPSLELPDPALDMEDPHFRPGTLTRRTPCGDVDGAQALNTAGEAGNGTMELINPHSQNCTSSYPRGAIDIVQPSRHSVPSRVLSSPKALLKKVFTSRTHGDHSTIRGPVDAFMALRQRESEFFSFLEKELAKIESFYHFKEKEATERLGVLRAQLHLMRDTRVGELLANKRNAEAKTRLNVVSESDVGVSARKWGVPLGNKLGKARSRKTSEAMEQLATPSGPLPMCSYPYEQRDFVRREDLNDVSYRSAKRKLKVALIEFYRGLELLKAYADLNRKGFRKMNKKYDKVTTARPAGHYVSEKVNKAWFVQSEVVENHMVSVEDLYARYFERGNRKVAIRKLRSKTSRTYDYSSNAFRNGLMFSGGVVLGVQGLTYAVHLLFHGDPQVRLYTAYLLQIYGGYFLALFHFLLFCMDCKIWGASKINYAFVFEFDTRHVLDWRELLEVPCLFVLLLGIILFLNFRWVNSLYIYWPILLIGITLLILFIPIPLFYHRSRRWWAYSNWRLLLAGFYPVEFRDFFLGDMYCSQVYAMSNIALSFCLYSKGWDNAPRCNSSHSRVMGFFSTVPSIWRSFQCLRRYFDTRNAFPHIANLGKYSFSILYYMTLSLYRIQRVDQARAIFITCASINSVYASIWDLAMDWSLCNPYSKNRFLRDSLAFHSHWVYYLAMAIDPILRFNWILYATFPHGYQHSAILSFFLAFSEVCRRGMWSIFRVENEHCTNVSRFRASRDVPLPYEIPSQARISVGRLEEQNFLTPQLSFLSSSQAATDSDEDNQPGPSPQRRIPSSLEIPRTLSRVGTMLATAHAQDFERRKQPGILENSSQGDHPTSRHDKENCSTDEEGGGVEYGEGKHDEEHDF
ncbi:SYG1 protein [Histoplasma ohiense]|nr:SYG1 protein [Histoplasma ohiense (nom. inval.)]